MRHNFLTLVVMEIKISTQQILKVLYIISWIIFIGICIEAGGYVFNAVYTMFYNPVGAAHLWNKLDLSALYNLDPGFFLVLTSIMSIVAILKAIMFYQIVLILHDKKLNMSRPFNEEMGHFMFRVSYLTLGIGLFTAWGAKYATRFLEQGVKTPSPEHLGLTGGDVWLFMGITLFVIAQIFKRGIEIQTENDLTV